METQQLKPLTVTQKKILKVLSDGLPHTKQELHRCLPDEMSGVSALWKHVCLARKHVRLKGKDILSVFVNRSIRYRLVKIISK